MWIPIALTSNTAALPMPPLLGLPLSCLPFMTSAVVASEGGGMSEETDGSVMERLVAGDRNALALLYDRYASLLLGVGCKMIRDRAEAEDILHDVFMEAWSKAKTYDATRGSVRGWLVLRMRSRIVDRIRSAPRRRELVSCELTESSAILQSEANPKLKTEETLLQNALHGLPKDLRDVVELVYFNALSIREAAQHLGWPQGTVKSRLFAARRELRQAMPERGLL